MTTRYYVPMKCSPPPSHQKKKIVSKKETEEHGKYHHRDEISKQDKHIIRKKGKGKGKEKL